MPLATDFRILHQFSLEGINKSGRNVGRTVYWKLYAIENLYRIIIHSILSVQIRPDWWPIAVDVNIRRKARNFKQKYLRRPWHTVPGQHYIYYTTLYDLNEIARANSHLFDPIVTDMDQWIVKIEITRLPRNIVAHMNFPNRNDRQRIDILYKDFKELIKIVESRPGITLQVPS